MERGRQKGEDGGRVMTEEQMEILRKQIAIYAVICRRLVSLHESLSSKLPLSSAGDGYFDPTVASSSIYKISHRHRWTPTSTQLQILESIYEEGRGTPKPQRIKAITLELSQHGQVMEKNVYNWFQNRRARSRRKQPHATTTTTTTVQAVDAAVATTEERRSYGDSGGFESYDHILCPSTDLGIEHLLDGGISRES